MAIYIRESDMVAQLDEVRESMVEYEANHNWREGYDTAYDVATCVNAETVWHKDAPPPVNEPVLVWLVAIHQIAVGVLYGDGYWQVDGIGSMDPKDVTMWMEMPDAPVEVEG